MRGYILHKSLGPPLSAREARCNLELGRLVAQFDAGYNRFGTARQQSRGHRPVVSKGVTSGRMAPAVCRIRSQWAGASLPREYVGAQMKFDSLSDTRQEKENGRTSPAAKMVQPELVSPRPYADARPPHAPDVVSSLNPPIFTTGSSPRIDDDLINKP
jgi:hypothetical protein